MYTRALLLSWTTGVVVFGIAAGALAAAVNDARSVEGKPPPDTTTWILVSAPRNEEEEDFSGVQLHAYDDSATHISRSLNPTTSASGDIAPVHERDRDFGCGCMHFHGFFGEVEDRDKKHCGWGCVIPFDGAPDSVGHLSTAVMAETRAIKKIKAGDLPGALDDIGLSREALGNAGDAAPEVGDHDWTERDGEHYQEGLDSAEGSDVIASASVSAAIDESNAVKKRKKLEKAENKLNAGLKKKRKLVHDLNKKLALSSSR